MKQLLRRVINIAAHTVVSGRSASSLCPYLSDITGRSRVRIICMDLSETDRSIARRCFPRALVVADRFHVVRLALYHLMKTCRQIDPAIATKRGAAELMQNHARNLTEPQEKRLSDDLAVQPAIASIYEFKEDLMRTLTAKNQSKDQCRILVHRLLNAIAMVKCSGFDDCRNLARTLEAWQIEIGRMWRFSRSNGITEGFHRSMKLIQRRAFGFCNFENY